jgi:hypothetical protein
MQTPQVRIHECSPGGVHAHHQREKEGEKRKEGYAAEEVHSVGGHAGAIREKKVEGGRQRQILLFLQSFD